MWDGQKYAIPANPTEPERGQRPVLALVGGAGDKIAIQFSEVKGKIVGNVFIIYIKV